MKLEKVTVKSIKKFIGIIILIGNPFLLIISITSLFFKNSLIFIVNSFALDKESIRVTNCYKYYF